MRIILIAFLLSSCSKAYIVNFRTISDKQMFSCCESSMATCFDLMVTTDYKEANAFCEKMRDKK